MYGLFNIKSTSTSHLTTSEHIIFQAQFLGFTKNNLCVTPL